MMMIGWSWLTVWVAAMTCTWTATPKVQHESLEGVGRVLPLPLLLVCVLYNVMHTFSRFVQVQVILYLLCGCFTAFIWNTLLSQIWNSIPSRVYIPTFTNYIVCVMIVQIFKSHWQKVMEGCSGSRSWCDLGTSNPNSLWHPTLSTVAACGYKSTFH